MSRLSEGTAKYILKQEDPELKKERKILGEFEKYFEKEVEFLKKETEASCPASYSVGPQFNENEIRRILYHKKWRC